MELCIRERIQRGGCGIPGLTTAAGCTVMGGGCTASGAGCTVMGGGCTASGAAGTGILWGVQWDVANQQGYSEEGRSKYIPALVSPQIQVIGDRDYT